MAKLFHLCIMTAEGTVFDGEVEYANLPTPGGTVGVLADHAPMLCALKEGETHCRLEDGSEKTFRHSAGVASVRDNTVTVLADRAET